MITDDGKRAFARLRLRTQSRTIDLAVQGFRYEEIAYRLQISTETVKQHLQRARQTFKARNTVLLAAVVVQRGWIKFDENEHKF